MRAHILTALCLSLSCALSWAQGPLVEVVLSGATDQPAGLIETRSSHTHSGGQLSQTSSSSVALSTTPFTGVPYWNYVCEDGPPESTGYTYENGDPAPCNVLGAYCNEGNNQAAINCPITCGTCAKAEAQWEKPWNDKSFETSAECSIDQVPVLNQVDQQKDQFCANMLYCLESKSPECDEVIEKWFGGTSADETEWTTLRSGFAKVCSASDYEYQCLPQQNCSITYSYTDPDGQTVAENNVQQSDVLPEIREEFNAQCQAQTGQCTYFGTVAWVYPSAADREINLCPMMFWLQSDTTTDALLSKASTILHELSHFESVANTQDLEFDQSIHLNAAESDPWGNLLNAPAWGWMAEDYDHSLTEPWSWSDFAALQSSTPSPGVLWFITRGNTFQEED